jgi:hypothetical protein
MALPAALTFNLERLLSAKVSWQMSPGVHRHGSLLRCSCVVSLDSDIPWPYFPTQAPMQSDSELHLNSNQGGLGASSRSMNITDVLFQPYVPLRRRRQDVPIAMVRYDTSWMLQADSDVPCGRSSWLQCSCFHTWRFGVALADDQQLRLIHKCSVRLVFHCHLPLAFALSLSLPVPQTLAAGTMIGMTRVFVICMQVHDLIQLGTLPPSSLHPQTALPSSAFQAHPNAFLRYLHAQHRFPDGR